MEENILRNTNYKLNIIKENLQCIKANLKMGGLTPKGVENYTENLQLCAEGLELIILEVSESVGGWKLKKLNGDGHQVENKEQENGD